MDWKETSKELPEEGRAVLVWLDNHCDQLGVMVLNNGEWWNEDIHNRTTIDYNQQEPPLQWAYIELPKGVNSKQY